ncbi:MAG TPA: hypothetical protein VHA05_03560 [Candidatus Saccharimonadales bacterium]|nr:hypothetical protein [Candidatus Saccharimonadales bacterium]
MARIGQKSRAISTPIAATITADPSFTAFILPPGCFTLCLRFLSLVASLFSFTAVSDIQQQRYQKSEYEQGLKYVFNESAYQHADYAAEYYYGDHGSGKQCSSWRPE